MTISNEILDKIKASGTQYATIHADLELNRLSNPIRARIKSAVGYHCSERDLMKNKHLDEILAVIISAIKSEKRKARKRSLFYNRFRHIELLHIYAYLIKKRSNS